MLQQVAASESDLGKWGKRRRQNSTGSWEPACDDWTRQRKLLIFVLAESLTTPATQRGSWLLDADELKARAHHSSCLLHCLLFVLQASVSVFLVVTVGAPTNKLVLCFFLPQCHHT